MRVENTGTIRMKVPMNNHVLTDAALASLVGQTPTVIKFGNWYDPLGHAEILRATQTAAGLEVVMRVGLDVIKALGHVDKDGKPVESVNGDDYSIGYRTDADVAKIEGKTLVDEVKVIEVCRVPANAPR